MTRRVLILLTLAAMALAAVGSTGANFSALTGNAGNRYDAKADWLGPTVTMTDPGTPLNGTVPLGASASDAGSGVQSVTIERSPAGANTWTTVCVDSGSPYSCSLDTTAGPTPDGLYDFRARASDNAGNSATSSSVTNRQIDNSPPTGVTMNDPGTNLAGTVSFSGSAVDNSGVASFKFQYRVAGGGLWLDACNAGGQPYGCSFNTTGLTDGLYDFRALATDAVNHTTPSPVHLSRRVDNVAPTATMNDPGTNLSTTVFPTAAATDAGGIANVQIQRRPNGGTTWTTICSTSVSPYTCAFNTLAGATPDGLYDFQAIATDNANRSTTSAVVLARRIDNTAPTSVTITNPGAIVTGTKSLNGAGSDGGSGIKTIELQYSPTGQNNWTTACSGNSSPTTCSFNTATAATPDGLYDFRTRATDNANNQGTSPTASPATRIDNTAPSVTMVSLGVAVRGAIIPSATASDGSGSGVASVSIEYRSSPAGAWVPLCTDNTPTPYSCPLNTATAATPDGLYDFRATAVDNVSKTATSAIITTRIDNTLPTGVAITDPGSPFGGTKTFFGAANDSGSGVNTLEIQYLNGATWTTVCTATVSPYQCSANTATLPIADGVYSFRSRATDFAGNVATSTAVASRRVDNTAPTATMTETGTNLRGVITLAATASDVSGIANVKFQYKTTAGSTWIDVCTDTTSTYSCTLDTAPLAAGDYDFRAVPTDNALNSGASPSLTPRRIDNYVRTLATGGCAATNDVVTVPAGGVAVGRTVLVRLAMRGAGAGAVSVTDSRGNVYTKDADVNELTARIAVFSAPVTTALLAGDTITASHPFDPDSSGVVAAELKNIVAAGRVDVVGTATGNSANPSASVGTTVAGDFLVGATANANQRGMTEASGWNLLTHTTQGCPGGSKGNAESHAGSRFAAAAGPFTYAPTLVQGDHWAMALLAYKTN
jgi:hypothetical protein